MVGEKNFSEKIFLKMSIFVMTLTVTHDLDLQWLRSFQKWIAHIWEHMNRVIIC